MEKIKVTNGVYWIDIPEAELYILCACPADIVKHLAKRGLIISKIKDGINYESGPNAILLSDVSIQNGNISNLAEFPVLQMLYKQGMIVPKHPNNTGIKPLLIGLSNQIYAQSQYIYRGNYGLSSIEEIKSTGISPEIAKEMFRIKMKFAFNKIHETEELIDFKNTDSGKIELRNGVYLTRKDLNIYEFEYKENKITVDLNLAPDEDYISPINLGFHKIKREYFSVIHIGEGNGWDVNRPCMSSIIVFQGKIYLIDTGPNILTTLTSLGISVNEIEGIFHTHAHDDHFAGLTSLVRSDHKIKYYAPPLIRTSVIKKLSALMSISEERFKSSFEIHDLKFNRWNNIEGLEVKPVFSPHPVETCVMLFRTFWEGGYKTYAHLADIASFEVLRKILINPPDKTELSKKIYKNLLDNLLVEADLKKIDIGGGLIHGRAEDFISDKSKKIVLSHTSIKLTNSQKEIGSNASFGMEDVLIPAQQDYLMRLAYHYLNNYFPDAPSHDINMLLNCPVLSFNAGLILIKKGETGKYVYLILNGVVEYIDSKTGFRNMLSSGSILGESAALENEKQQRTYRTMSYIRTLQIPAEIYTMFIERNLKFEDMKRIYENKTFLQSTWLFGEMVSSMLQNRIAKSMKLVKVSQGEDLSAGKDMKLYILKKGSVQIFIDNKLVDTMKPGSVFGEESVFLKESSLFSAKTVKDSVLYLISDKIIREIPIIEWKMLETFERRLQAFGTQFSSN